MRGENNGQGLLRTLIVLSVPTIIEQLLSTLLQYVDTAMVGRLGEQATASVSITTTITWLVNSIPSAIGVAVLALVARYLGSRDNAAIKDISKQSLILVVISGILLGGISVLLSPFIPRWMGAEEAIQEQAAIYFAIISIPMVFRSASTVFGAAIRATKDTKTPMIISVLANVINIVCNALFIYGLHWGVTGAAIGSALSYIFSGIAMFFAYRKKDVLYFCLKELSINNKKLLECAKVGVPILGTNLASCLGYVVFASLVSDMGTTTFAAHSIAVTAETLFYIPGYGLRTATSTLIGHALGERDRKKFESTAYLSVFVTMGIMVLNGVFLFFAARPLMNLLTSSEAVAALGAKMLRLVAFSEPFFGLMIIMEGIFYGLGRTQYTFLVETFSMWAVRILLTVFCVKLWHLPLQAVWVCMIADNVCKAVLLTIPILSKRFRGKLFVVDN